MRTQLVCLSLLLAGLMLSSSGCVVLAVGAGAAGTVAYAKGDLEAEEQHSIDEVYAAAKKATGDLKLHVITGEGGKDALSATLVARDAADKRITIRLRTVAEDVTKMSIRVGTFGSSTKQRLIYNKIRENLKAMAPQPAQAPAAPSEPGASTPPTESSPQPSQTPSEAPASQPAQAAPDPPNSPEPAQTPPESVAARQPAQESVSPPVPQ